MQVSNRTLTILKNFVTINPGIIFKPGNIIRTCNDGPDIFAIATTEDTIDRNFAVADLSQFISLLSSFDKPDIVLGDNSLSIHNGAQRATLTYGEESFIYKNPPPEKDITMPKSILAEFTLSEIDLQKLNRIAGVLSSPEVAIVGEGGELSVQGLNVKDPTGNVYSHKLGSTKNSFQVVFTTDKLNSLLSMDYVVTIGKGIVRFVGKDVTYFVAPLAGKSIYE